MFPAGVCRTAQFETMIHDVKPAYYAVMQSESALKATDTNLTQYGELDRVVFQRVSQEVVAAIEYLELEGSVSQPEVRAGQIWNTSADPEGMSQRSVGPSRPHRFITQHVPGFLRWNRVPIRRGALRNGANVGKRTLN